MRNLPYCRFRNTVDNFNDCLNNLRTLDPANSDDNVIAERRARRRLVILAARMLEELGVESTTDDFEIERLCDELDGPESFQPEDHDDE